MKLHGVKGTAVSYWTTGLHGAKGTAVSYWTTGFHGGKGTAVSYWTTGLHGIKGTAVSKLAEDYELKQPVYLSGCFLTSDGFYADDDNCCCYICKLAAVSSYSVSRNKKSSRFRICLNEINPLLLYLDFDSAAAKCKPSYFVDNSSLDDLTTDITTGENDIYLSVYYTNAGENDIVINVTPKEAK